METTINTKIVLPQFTETETETLKKYFEYNRKYYDIVNEELTAKLANHPLWGPLLKMQTPEQQKQQNERSLEMQRAAIYDGKWEEYNQDLILQGRTYARMNVNYADWYQLIKMYKNHLVPYIKKDFADDAENGITFFDGLTLFIDHAMNCIAEAYFTEKNNSIKANEERFRAIFDNSTDSILVIDSHARIKMINHVAPPVKKEDAIGKSIFDFYFNDNHELIKKAIKKVFEQKTSSLFEATVEIKGTFLYYSCSLSPVFNNQGGVMNAVIISRDITKQKMDELQILQLNASLEKKVNERTRKLKESEEKFNKTFSLSPAGIALAEYPSGKFSEVNNSFLQMLGYSHHELVGHTSLELKLVDATERAKILDELTRNDTIKNKELSYNTKSGEKLHTLFSSETIIVNDKKYFLSVLYDITQRKKMEEQLESVNKELDSFTYSVSHDLRAPLRAINGYTQMLMEGYAKNFDSEAERLMKTVILNSKRMGQLIDDLLTFSRLGRQQIVKTKTDMHSLIHSVVNDLKAQHKDKKIQMEIKPIPPAYGDLAMLKQVVVNLVSNAIKYSGKKEKSLIEIGSYAVHKEMVYYIKDNGAGFDMAHYNKLFGVFQRLHAISEFEGTGVGLSIVHRIITKHNGKVWAEAKPDEGATFYFSLPD